MSDSESEAGGLFGDEEGSKKSSPVQQRVLSPASDNDQEDVGDLFGDDDDEEEASIRQRVETTTPASHSKSPNPLEYAEEEEAVPQKQNIVTLPIPQWPHTTASDNKIWQMKLPSYVNIDSRPFDAEYYRATQDEEPIDGAAHPVAAKSMMIGVKNTIRWRWITGPDGEPIRQSNARMLRWSNGSVTLQLGSDFFDVAPSHGATLVRPSDPQPTPKQDIRPVQNSSTTFLAVGAAAERVLVTEGPIAGQLSLLPTSMQSKTYLELVKHVEQQHTKHSKMKMLEETQDEEALQALLLKSAPNREAIKDVKARTRRSYASRKTNSKRRKSKKVGYSDSESEAESSGDNGPKHRKGDKEMFDYEDDDGFVVADSDENDYGSKKKSKKTKKRKGVTNNEEESLDEMEEAERRIEEREREKKRARKDKIETIKKSREYVDTDEGEETGDQDAEGEEEMDIDMDVESEEE
ncbi:hypothetical protein L204_100911 [Cryptococcus depauperatus]|nr:RNA polymerase-associated protein LEO1 [Cryptococcus depauperatus CBS 7855]